MCPLRDPSPNLNAPELSIVVPLYNEEQAVEELCARLWDVCQSLDVDFEIVLVNDGSVDTTLPRLISLGRKHPEMRIIDLLRNFGHMAALTAGMEAARGRAVITMDGDLQDPPELIPQLVAKWRDGAEVVYALRASRGEPWLKRIGTAGFYKLLSVLTRAAIPRQAGTFALMDRQVVDVLIQLPERTRFLAGLRAWVGGRQEFVPYNRPDRPSGRSRVGARGLFRLARAAVLSFTSLPLRVSSVLALLASGVFLLIGVTVLSIRLITNLAIPGWASTMTMIGLVGAVQSLVLFFLCEYVAVIFDELKHRPLYVVRREISPGKRASESEVSDKQEEGDPQPAKTHTSEVG